MDPFLRILARLALWLRRPPSRTTALAMLAALALVLAVVLIEAVFGWPEALTVNQRTRILR